MGVRREHGMACPACEADTHIEVVATHWVRLAPDGTDYADDGSEEWDDTSPARCCECDHTGTVATFTVTP